MTQTMWRPCVRLMGVMAHAASSTNDKAVRGRSLDAEVTWGESYTQLPSQIQPNL